MTRAEFEVARAKAWTEWDRAYKAKARAVKRRDWVAVERANSRILRAAGAANHYETLAASLSR